MLSISQRIAEELSVNEKQVIAAVDLLDEGSTVPFISRYRKGATGGLDDTQLRMLEERLRYLRELDERRETILKSIDDQEKLTPELKASIMQADTKNRLEDLYLPYKQKRRTKAQIAKEAGLEPLAVALFENPELQPESEAEKYIDSEKAIKDTKMALDGARQILMERFAEEADLLKDLARNMQSITKNIDDLKKEKKELTAKQKDFVSHFIRILGICYPGVKIDIRGVSHEVENLTQSIEYYLDPVTLKLRRRNLTKKKPTEKRKGLLDLFKFLK